MQMRRGLDTQASKLASTDNGVTGACHSRVFFQGQRVTKEVQGRTGDQSKRDTLCRPPGFSYSQTYVDIIDVG